MFFLFKYEGFSNDQNKVQKIPPQTNFSSVYISCFEWMELAS